MLKILAYHAVFLITATIFFIGVPVQAAHHASQEAQQKGDQSNKIKEPAKIITHGPPVPQDIKEAIQTSTSAGEFLSSKKIEKISISTPTPIPSFSIEKVRGVSCKYIYTDRIAKADDGTCYTKMREKPDVKSKRLAILENGDKVQVNKLLEKDQDEKEQAKDQTESWVYLEIISSHDKERIGKKGYIEEWIITGKNVPEVKGAITENKKEALMVTEEDQSEEPKKVEATQKTDNQKEKDTQESAESEGDPDILQKEDIIIVAGVKSEYMYTYRVDEDADGAFTKMREKPDVNSDRIGQLRNGDKFQVQEETDGWLYGEIISSSQKKQIGVKGYIESWLLTDTGVPPEPTATPTPDPADTPPPVDAQIMNGDARVIFDKVNAHRQSIGLPPLAEDGELCGYAAERAPEINNEIFGNSYVHAGYRERGLSSLGIIENQVGMGSVDANFNWWMNSGLHRGSIEGNFGGTCVACVGASCIQLFR